jgi:hypothetical protein
MIIEILGEQVIERNGDRKKVRRWLRGKHPELGKIIRGYTGYETVQEVEVIKPEILGEEVVYQNGCFKRVKRWLKGIHPELGTIVRGYTGWETLQELDIIKANGTFYVMPDVIQVPSRSEESKEECLDLQSVA